VAFKNTTARNSGDKQYNVEKTILSFAGFDCWLQGVSGRFLHLPFEFAI